MKIEKFNDSSKKIKLAFVIGVILTALLFILVNIFLSKAKYQNTESVKIVEGKVNYVVPDLNVMAVYLKNDKEYVTSKEIPKSGYVLSSDSYCTVPDNKKQIKEDITYKDGKVYIGINKKGTKCYIYFNSLADVTLAKLKQESKGTKESFTGPSTEEETGIYSTYDDEGLSYYYRGLVENNYVKFANFYWRIIRINGDGSIRMIYAGSKGTANGACDDCSIGSGAYNTEHDDNKYVGFRYTDADAHGTTEESDILKNETYGLNKWYETNILGKDEENNIEKSAGFCNDRTNSTNASTAWGSQNNEGGIESAETYYGAYLRLRVSKLSWATLQMPTLKCTENSDLFTAKNDKSKGNQSLTYPVGLITADEVIFAGGFGGTASQNYYLYTGQYFWTMSPFNFINGSAYVFSVSSAGNRGSGVDDTNGVRPVINLKADTEFKADSDGSFDHPFEVI